MICIIPYDKPQTTLLKGLVFIGLSPLLEVSLVRYYTFGNLIEMYSVRVPKMPTL